MNNEAKEKKIKLRVALHATGRKSILRSDITSITITKADGTVDEVTEEHNLGEFTTKEAEKLMRNPQGLNIKRMSKGKMNRKRLKETIVE